jgi:hypothetical protein
MDAAYAIRVSLAKPKDLQPLKARFTGNDASGSILHHGIMIAVCDGIYVMGLENKYRPVPGAEQQLSWIRRMVYVC